MNEIYNKLFELWELLKDVPQECKGDSPEASKNRREWLHIRSIVHQLVHQLIENK